jgi:hypothetical protein
MLKEQMKNARDDIYKVEKNTVDTMKLLLDLDNIKMNMIDASNALQVPMFITFSSPFLMPFSYAFSKLTIGQL